MLEFLKADLSRVFTTKNSKRGYNESEGTDLASVVGLSASTAKFPVRFRSWPGYSAN